MNFNIETIPPLIVTSGNQFVVCGGDDISAWLTKDTMRNASAVIIFDRDRTAWNRHAFTLSNYQFVLKLLDLANIRVSSRYNPFAYIGEEKDVAKLANALITGTIGFGEPGDIAFISAETMLFTALINLIHNDAPDYERNFNTLVRALKYMDSEKYDEGFDYKDAVDILFDEREAVDPNLFSVRQYRLFQEMTGTEAKDVILSCVERLAPFDTGEAYDFLSCDELRLNTIAAPKTAFFINIGKEETPYNLFASLMYSQLFDVLCENSVQ
jgi:type IV secretion system protein VirD4